MRPSAPRLPLYLGVFVAGLGFSLLGAALPDLAARFSLDNQQASLFPLAMFVGDFCGLLALGFLLDRPFLLLTGSSVLLGLSSASIALISSFSLLALSAFFLLGAGSGVLITLPGMLVSRSSEGEAAGSMNLLYGFFSGGVMLAPAGAGLLFSAGIHYPAAFLVLAGCSAALFIALMVFKTEAPSLGGGLRLSSLRGLFQEHGSLAGVVIMMNLFYVGAEAVPNAWIPKYLDDMFPGGNELRDRFVLSFFWAAMTGGRFVAAWAFARGVHPMKALKGLALAASLSLAAAPFFQARLPAEAGFIISGFFFSGIFPVIISTTKKLPEDAAGALFILVMAGGMAGAAAAGALVGVLARHVSFRAGMALASLFCLAVFLLARVLERQLKE